MPRPALLLLLVLCSSCLTASARLRAGPTVDTGGEIGWELGVSAGIGVAVSDRTGVRAMPGFAASDRAAAAFTESIEFGAAGDRLDWVAGLTGELFGTGDEQAMWLFATAVVPVIGDARRDAGHEKIGFGGTSRWALGAGLETRAGVVAGGPDGDRDRRGIFAILPAIDLTAVTTMDL